MPRLFAIVDLSQILPAIVLIAAMSVCPVRLTADDFTWEAAPASGNWDNPNNWSGPNLQFPDDNTDTALVDTFFGLMPTLTANRTVGELTIQNGGDVSTGNGANNFSLLVQNNVGASGTVTIDGLSDQFEARLEVYQSPAAIDLDTDQLVINDFGTLRIRNNAFVQVDQSFRTDFHISGSGSGTILGGGTLEFGADSLNDGILRTSPGLTFTIQSTGGAGLDLDGATGDGGIVTDTTSTLVVNAPLSDTLFNGLVIINPNSEVQINQSWSLASDGQIFFEGESVGVTGPATLSGGDTELSGDILVESGTAILAASQTIVSDTAVVTLADHTTLQFDALTHFENPDSIENGFGGTTFVVNSDVLVGGLVAGAVVGNFDWDGIAQPFFSHTIVNPGGALFLNVVGLDAPGIGEIYSGFITIDSGFIEVQNADGQWEMDGVLTMRNTANEIPVLSGATGTQVLISGDVVVEGSGVSRISERSIFGSTSHVDVAAGASLQIGSAGNGTDTVINGGTWTGAGAVDLDADFSTVSAATVVDMPNGTFDIDGDVAGDMVVLNAPLTLNVNSVDNNDANQIDDTVRINANGRLDVRLTNSNLSYTIDDNLDLNGLGGGLASLHLSGADVELQVTTTVTGNSVTQARIDLTGHLNLAAGSTFNLNGGTLTDSNIIFESATFGGSGDLIVSTNRALQIEDGTFVGVDVVNRGRFEPGLSIGSVDLAGNFQQASSGTFAVELAGTPVVDRDQLDVTGTANLDGRLIVKLIDEGNGVPAPQIGDQFTVLTAAGGVFGQFDNEPISLANGDGYQWEVIYNPNNVRIRVDSIIPNLVLGDINGDGAVTLLDVAPFVTVLNNGVYIVQADINCDGVVNLLDVNPFVELLIGG